MTELWLRNASDDPTAKTYALDYRTGCMIQPPIEDLVERVNQMASHLDAEVVALQTHAKNALKAEHESDWDSAHLEHTEFLRVLHGVGFDEWDSVRAFRRYGDYLYLTAWAGIPCALYTQIKLGDYRKAVEQLGALRATRDAEIGDRLPMFAYASIEQHIRIIDWETSYTLKERGHTGLAPVLAQRAVRDFPGDWLLNAETSAEATLCHLLACQHRKFGQYDKARQWRLELRKCLLNCELSLDAEVQIGLDDVYLLCDMDEYRSALLKLLELKQRISDHGADSKNFVQLRRVMEVDNAWLQCQRYLALQDPDFSNEDLPEEVWKELALVAAQITIDVELVPPATARLTAAKLLQEVAQPVSCTDDFKASLGMIEKTFSASSKATISNSKQDGYDSEENAQDFFFDSHAGRARTNPLYFPLFLESMGEFLNQFDVDLGTLMSFGSGAVQAEEAGVWNFSYTYYQVFLTVLGDCDMPPPGSYYPGMYCYTILIWAALPYALAYHTQFKDYEHSIWILRNVQIVMEGFAPHPLLKNQAGVTTAAYAAVELQVRMATWEWSCMLQQQGEEMRETAEALSHLATSDFPYQHCEALENSEALLDDEDDSCRAKASLCKLLANLYNGLAQIEEARRWDAELAKYVTVATTSELRTDELPRFVAGRIPRMRSGLPPYPRIEGLRPWIRRGPPPPRSTGSSSPERSFNGDPNNSYI